MKKTLFLLPIFLLPAISTFAATEQDKQAASFLAQKDIIATSYDYKLESTITRREMLKIMMNLSGLEVNKKGCEQLYVDLPTSDWGCPYARAAAANGFIATSFGRNNYFRPNDPVTNIEALKMIMQARGIQPIYNLEYDRTTDWRKAYMLGGNSLLGIGGNLIAEDSYKNSEYYAYNTDVLKGQEYFYNTLAKRKYVFLASARTLNDFLTNTSYWRNYDSNGIRFKFPENWIYDDRNDTYIYLYSKDKMNRQEIIINKVTGEINYDRYNTIESLIKSTYVFANSSSDFYSGFFSDSHEKLSFYYSQSDDVIKGNQIIQIKNQWGNSLLDIMSSEGEADLLFQHAKSYSKTSGAYPLEEIYIGANKSIFGYLLRTTSGRETIYVFNPKSGFFLDISYDKNSQSYESSILPVLNSLEFQ